MKISADSVTPETERLIREIGIPPCPQVLLELMNEVRSDDTDLNRISHLISKDVGLAAAVMKAANSALYGLRHKVKTINAALAGVGLDCAANLIAGLMLRRAFPDGNHAGMQAFWESTSRVGLTTAFLGRELGVADINEAHTYGLFRDCGAPLLMHKFPDYCNLAVAAETQGAQDVTEMENARFGVHHAAIGAHLAMSWYLPEDIWHAIQMHHAHHEAIAQDAAQPGTTATLIALGTLADCMYRMHRGVAMREHWEHEQELAYAVLGVRRQDMVPLESDLSRLLSGD